MEGTRIVRVFRHMGQWWGKLDGLAVFVGPCIADTHAKTAIIAAARDYATSEPRFLAQPRVANPPVMTLDNVVLHR